MLFISELPVFFLVAPTNYPGIVISFLFLIACSILARKYGLNKKHKSDKKELFFSVAFALLAGIMFVQKWAPSSKAAAVSSAIGLPAKTFLTIAGVLLSAASIYGLLNIIAILKELDSRMSQRENDISDRKFYQWFGIILAFCTVVYCTLLGGRYVWADEAYSFAMIEHSFPEIWKITAADVHPPLYYFILKILTKPFHYSLLSAKIVSVIPYLFILAFGGIQFKKLFGKKTGLFFMVLFFFFPFSIEYVIEVRMYSLAAAFVFGNAVYAYRCYREEKKSNWIFFSILGVCSAYTHYYALISTGIVYGILLIALIIKKREKLLPWCLASLLTVLLYIPWLKCFIEQLVYKVNNEYWISRITLRSIDYYFRSIFASSALFALAYLLSMIGVVKRKVTSDTILCVCMLAIPFGTIAVGVLASVAVRPVFVIRYVAPSIPLLLAYLALSASRNGHGWVRVYALSISIVIGIIGYTSFFQSEYAITENALDKSFVTQCSDAECFVITSKNAQVRGVLSYYDPNTPIYSGEYWPASPYPNLYPIGEFDAGSHDTVVLLTDNGKEPPTEYLNEYHCDYINQIDECGYIVNAYWLTK